MKDEYDFSNAERGKFYRPGLRLIPPVRLEPEVLSDGNRGLSPVVVLVLLLACLACGQAVAASFDCGKTSDVYERFVICGESGIVDDEARGKLIKLNSELNLVYKEALKKYFDPMLLKQEQRTWIKARNWYFLPDKKISRIDFKPGLVLMLYQNRISDLRYDIAHSPKSKSERISSKMLSMASPPGVGVIPPFLASSKSGAKRRVSISAWA